MRAPDACAAPTALEELDDDDDDDDEDELDVDFVSRFFSFSFPFDGLPRPLFTG